MLADLVTVAIEIGRVSLSEHGRLLAEERQGRPNTPSSGIGRSRATGCISHFVFVAALYRAGTGILLEEVVFWKNYGRSGDGSCLKEEAPALVAHLMRRFGFVFSASALCTCNETYEVRNAPEQQWGAHQRCHATVVALALPYP